MLCDPGSELRQARNSRSRAKTDGMEKKVEEKIDDRDKYAPGGEFLASAAVHYRVVSPT